MNWIDILVLVIAIIIMVALISYFVLSRKKSKCNSCPTIKKYKRALKKAKKEINKDNVNKKQN